jgi:protein O-GlcNAc transferase
LDEAAALRQRGNDLLGRGLFSQAVSSYLSSLSIEPDNVRGHNNLGQALMRLGKHAEAVQSFRRALELDPNYAIGYNNLGIALYEQGDFDAAVACYQRALQLNPAFSEAHNNLGNVLVKLNRAGEALGHFESAMLLKPAMLNHGNALQQLKLYGAAVESYERALAAEPDNAEALSNCASALLALKRPEEALSLCERAIRLEPDFPEAYNNLGGALRRLGRYEEAAAACKHALRIKPRYAAAFSNLANISLANNLPQDAIEYCDRAIALDPDLAEAHEQRGGALVKSGRPEDAALEYARLLELAPEHNFALGALASARLACCDWVDYEPTRDRIIAAVEAGKPVVQPFTLLAMCDSPELHLQCAKILAAEQMPANCRLPWNGKRYRHERIRVAYLSADYHQHATAILMAGLFEAHDRSRFETTAISFGPDDAGPMRQRLKRAFDRFLDVRNESDAGVATLMQSLEIDIAVDLKGYTGDSRPAILARRPAPIQVSYLGYPGTMGLEQIDYLLADPTALPPELRAQCSEAVVYLPDCYQVNDSNRAIADHTPTRAELGLPESQFVFCCFNNNYKLTPEIFSIWMQLLLRVPGSVLWLLGDNPAAVRNLRGEAERRGVSPERLVFAPRLPAEQHLARHRLADLFLDTLPYNAHTTSSDALWAGLPVLTCLGRAFPGRVAASLLNTIGLPELVTRSPSEYAERAFELATDGEQLRSLRDRLALNRPNSPLFDTGRFCRHLESAYTTMWRRYEDGLVPETFAVTPSFVTES